MKKIKVVSMILMLLATMSVFANSGADVNPEASLCAQIRGMLKKNSFKVASEDWTAQVFFTINKDGELVVLSVDTENSSLENFIKGRLNYRKVNLDNIPSGKVFTLPVRVTA